MNNNNLGASWPMRAIAAGGIVSITYAVAVSVADVRSTPAGFLDPLKSTPAAAQGARAEIPARLLDPPLPDRTQSVSFAAIQAASGLGAVVIDQRDAEPLLRESQPVQPLPATVSGPPPVTAPVIKVAEEGRPPAAPVSLVAANKVDARQIANSLAGAERLRIKLLGHAELSGDYVISADRTISVPAVGRISVTNMTISELEDQLAKVIANRAKREVFATVEVAQYRPVFVAGQVTEAGSHPWTTSMTIMHAVALAGGIRTEVAPDGTSDRSRQRTSYTNLKYATALLTRLRAERNDAATLAVPHRLVQLVGKDEAATLMDKQRVSMEMRKSAFNAQVTAMQLEIESSRLELAALDAQKENIQEQLRLRRHVVEALSDLHKKKVITQTRMFDALTSLSELEERASTNLVTIARTNARFHTLQNQIVQLRQQRQEQVSRQIDELEREVELLEAQLPAGGFARDPASDGTTRDGQAVAGRQNDLYFRISRTNGTVKSVMLGDLLTELMPGDMVLVGRGATGDLGMVGTEVEQMLEGSGTPPRRISRSEITRALR